MTRLTEMRHDVTVSARRPDGSIALCHFAIAILAIAVSACKPAEQSQPAVDRRAAANPATLLDGNKGDDWAAYGQSFGEQHYSPLAQIDTSSVTRLGLAWSYDLPAGNPLTGPLAIDGKLYTATGYSVVRAFDAANGKLLWTFDPKAPEAAGRKLRTGYGSRGLAWWDGKLYVGTQDGRLIAIDAGTGRRLWSAMTVEPNDYRFISGAPRVFAGKVIIGHGGADTSDLRGYVTAYNADTGRKLWRFYTVPGDPAKGFEDATQAMAAKTWAGEWWKRGGGGTVWNSFTYDAENDTIFIGVGNGAPWNHRVRSAGKGDNLFLASIVALSGKTGAYKWHYQFNPGETWDYNASMDMQLADIMIDGKQRKVVMEAPKNGFFYVIDRLSGKLISADKIAKVSWAKGIDIKTGRPIEVPEARYPDGHTFALFPGPQGAHTWLPSAYSPKSGLMYLPVLESGTAYNDRGIDVHNWRRTQANSTEAAVNLSEARLSRDKLGRGTLLAWNPVTRKAAWRVPTAGGWNGGVMATGGGLVFQGEDNGRFTAYDAVNGKPLWRFDAQTPVLAPPISYSVKGRQYVTVLTGIGTSVGAVTALLSQYVDYRTQARRVLTFALDGTATIPRAIPAKPQAAPDPDFVSDAVAGRRGAVEFNRCQTCHGISAVGGGTAPDLRTSGIPVSAEAFEAVVRQGVMVPAGMPRFEEMTDRQMDDLRQYIRAQAAALRQGASSVSTPRKARAAR